MGVSDNLGMTMDEKMIGELPENVRGYLRDGDVRGFLAEMGMDPDRELFSLGNNLAEDYLEFPQASREAQEYASVGPLVDRLLKDLPDVPVLDEGLKFFIIGWVEYQTEVERWQ